MTGACRRLGDFKRFSLVIFLLSFSLLLLLTTTFPHLYLRKYYLKLVSTISRTFLGQAGSQTLRQSCFSFLALRHFLPFSPAHPLVVSRYFSHNSEVELIICVRASSGQIVRNDSKPNLDKNNETLLNSRVSPHVAFGTRSSWFYFMSRSSHPDSFQVRATQ